MSESGRLEYWKAKAAESYRLFYEQLPDQAQQDICVENLVDFIKANRELEKLQAPREEEWIHA